VVQTDGAGLARQGVPLDRFNMLIVSGWTLAGPLRQSVLTLFAPHVGGMVLVDEVGSAASTGNASDHSCRSVFLRRLGAQRVQMVQMVLNTQALPAAVLRCVQALPDGG
jgi:hypothetical protein